MAIPLDNLQNYVNKCNHTQYFIYLYIKHNMGARKILFEVISTKINEQIKYY